MSIDDKILIDRESIRNQLTTDAKDYLDLQDVDLNQSSFVSYIINMLSSLESNLLFYEASSFKEFFQTKAQLPESVSGHAAFFGYTPSKAKAATANVLIKIPMTFSTGEFEGGKSIKIGGSSGIPEGFEFYAGSISFLTYYTTYITIYSNTQVEVEISSNGKSVTTPVTISDGYAYFLLPVKQQTITTDEFSIDLDIQTGQFVSHDFKIEGELSAISVEVDEGYGYRTYKEYQSLFLIPKDEYGYVIRTTQNGKKIYFGNGLLGYQPAAGSRVKLTIKTTFGASGNVIAGSIKSSKRLYYTTNTTPNIVVNIQYTATNPSPATGGENEETMEEIRTNSISSLSTLHRLVSKSDYEQSKNIIDSFPTGSVSLPILKRSDLKCNEIVLFTTLKNEDVLLPTVNASQVFALDSTADYIYRNSVLTDGDKQLYTLFDIHIDRLNSCCYYNYVIKKTSVTPTLQLFNRINNQSYNFSINSLTAEKIENSMKLTLAYTSDETDTTSCECDVFVYGLDENYSMTHDTTNCEFTITFDPYTALPKNSVKLDFSIYITPSGSEKSLLCIYTTTMVFRQELDKFMMSNIIPTDGTNWDEVKIYDIPTISKEYYDSLYDATADVPEQKQMDLETNVLQQLLTSFKPEEYNMITDFINLKFCTTYGHTNNMQLNATNRTSVKNIVSELPSDSTVGTRYILRNNDSQYNNNIALKIDSTSYYYVKPMIDDILYITELDKKYIYTESGWVYPNYEIPVKINLEVFKKSTTPYSDAELISAIKESLVSTFSSRFGPDVNLYHSEIISCVQSIDGVDHCHVIKPESNIFFNFEIDDLTQEQLLSYTPSYIYFSEADITINIS